MAMAIIAAITAITIGTLLLRRLAAASALDSSTNWFESLMEGLLSNFIIIKTIICPSESGLIIVEYGL